MNHEHLEGRNLPPCGLTRRLLAAAYDGVIVLALLLLAGLVTLPLGSGSHQALKDPVFTLYLLSVWFLYLGWCWRRAGMTLGMRAWGVRLVTANGQPPGWGACLLRLAVALLGAAALGLGFLWSVPDPLKRGWHDRASGTRLVVLGHRSG
jgi:uncharacterized RDD family membrane protein YckC